MLTIVFLGAPFLLSAVLAFMLARGWRHVVALVGLGAVLAFLFVLSGYLAAPASYSTSCGSECEEYLGRWWEPAFVGAVAVFGSVAYLAGVSVGSVARLFIPRRPAPGSSRRAG